MGVAKEVNNKRAPALEGIVKGVRLQNLSSYRILNLYFLDLNLVILAQSSLFLELESF